MRDPHERFQPLLHIRHDHEFIDDRVRRLGGNDPRLADTDVTTVLDALLGVTDGRAFHRPLHRARSTAGADVQLPEPERVADLFRVQVLFAADRVPAPAHDNVGVTPGADDLRVA